MTEVKSRRYVSALREDRARATRRAVLDSARTLFVERGYVATSVDEVARLAGVAKPTVFASVGSKRELLKQLRDVALAGDDQPIAVRDRPWFQEMLEEPDQRCTLRLHVRNIRQIYDRYARIERVLLQAAGADPEMRELWQVNEEQRMAGSHMVAASLAAKGPLRTGVDEQSAAELLWVLASGDLYLRLVDDRGWPPARYEQWLADTLTRLLLP